MTARPRSARRTAIAVAAAVAIVAVVLVALVATRDRPPREFVASADATILGDEPTTPLGSRNRLSVDAAPPEASLIRFDVDGLGSDVRPTNATLRLFAVNGSDDGGQVSLVASDWDEATATWEAHAPAAGAVIADIGAVDAGRWVEVPLGSLVGVDGPYSLLLSSTASNGADYASRETDTPPTLVVEEGAGPPPAAASPTTAATTPSDTATATASPADPSPTDPTSASPEPATTAPVSPDGPLLVAAVGDLCGSDCDRVAELVAAAEPDLVLAAGDLAYPDGTIEQYRENYDPAWGRFKDITRSVPGNHEWHTPNAQGWRDYFGVPTGPTYSSFDAGGWHVIGLDTDCDEVGGCTPGSPQYEWLVRDLAAMDERCSIAFYHHATFSDGLHGNTPNAVEFWRAMDAAGVDVVLAGHDHSYQRFVPQRADGTADPQGIRGFVVGTGGAGLYAFDANPLPNREVGFSEHGALFLTLGEGSYSWEWKDLGGTVRDEGRAECV